MKRFEEGGHTFYYSIDRKHCRYIAIIILSANAVYAVVVSYLLTYSEYNVFLLFEVNH